MEKTAYISELNRTGIEIKKELPNIHRAFDPDVVEETIRLYVNEARKQSPKRDWFPAEIEETYRDGVDEPPKKETLEEERDYLRIEDIVGAIDPLKGLFISSSIITYYVRAGKMDVFFHRFQGNGWFLLYYCEDDGSVDIYFTLSPHFNFTREEIRAKKEHIIFSGRNVFELLGIEYPQVSRRDKRENLIFRAETDIFSVTDENAERIKRQNERKISVIIGNPPYNANQMNENENNKNREYPKIDKRIKDTYIKHSTAQKTKVYDMYARFYRWAMDRLDENGVIAFITNRSFIDSRTFDGFRKTLMKEFDYAYIIDTKSDVRQNPKIAGTTHNVFGIQTGVAIMFLIKKHNKDNNTCRISYVSMQDDWRKEDKLQWLSENKFEGISFEHIQPDKDNNWINLVENDWEEMIPLQTKE